uniref:G-protein coupled receptors family 1 profile domain-containing protein n=2 Tax=Plectus sambesii TaxID=2011161 RepID=A0A914V8F0_9BILA
MEGDDALLQEQCTSVNTLLEAFDDWTLRLDVKVAYSVIYSCIFVVGLLGNGLLIENIVRRKRYYSVPNLFLLNLAISDVLLCITALPITPVLAFLKEWLFGELMCKLVPLCQATSVLISSYCLCFIALDRYRNIVTTTKEPWNLRSASILMAFSWLASVLVSGPLFLSQQLDGVNLNNITICGQFCGEYNWPNHHTKVGYGFVLLGVQFLIPVSLMCFCYWKILQK